MAGPDFDKRVEGMVARTAPSPGRIALDRPLDKELKYILHSAIVYSVRG